MLPRKHTIGNRFRVEQIFKKGRRISGRFFQWRYMLGRSATNQFSLILPKKLGRTAVLRNTLRRRVYEAIRRNLEHTPKTCYHVVCLLSPRIANASYAEIENDVRSLMKKLP